VFMVTGQARSFVVASLQRVFTVASQRGRLRGLKPSGFYGVLV
jgi:hypothetical protein